MIVLRACRKESLLKHVNIFHWYI